MMLPKRQPQNDVRPHKSAYVIAMLMLLVAVPSLAQARLVFQDDTFSTIDSDGIILDNNNNTAGDISIQFGATLGETIKWSGSNSRFEFSDSIDLNSNQVIEARLENLSALPGGASGPGAVTGRIVQLTSSDSTAPGCTSTACSAGAYSWNGSTWDRVNVDITGTTANTYTLDSDNTGGNVTLQYGATNAETITWNNANTRFDFSDDLNITGGILVSGSNSTFGATSGTTRVDINGDLALRANGVVAASGTNNNLGSGTFSYIKISGPTADFTITGLNNGVNGRVLIIYNAVAFNMTIANDNASSTASNRILTLTGGDVTTTGVGTVILIYDSNSSRWIQIANNL